jgi:hypothetical protein
MRRVDRLIAVNGPVFSTTMIGTTKNVATVQLKPTTAMTIFLSQPARFGECAKEHAHRGAHQRPAEDVR